MDSTFCQVTASAAVSWQQGRLMVGREPNSTRSRHCSQAFLKFLTAETIVSRRVEPYGAGKGVTCTPDPVLPVQAWLCSLCSPESSADGVARDASINDNSLAAAHDHSLPGICIFFLLPHHCNCSPLAVEFSCSISSLPDVFSYLSLEAVQTWCSGCQISVKAVQFL